MHASETWADGPSPTPPSAPPEAGGVTAVPVRDTIAGRATVLPRVEVEGDAPRLVQEERPRFEATKQIGEGGLGVVVAAKDLDIGRRVAIKRIRPEVQSKGAFLRFVQEVRTVGRLDHPNIVPIHDVGKDEHGGFYFVMKYVEGETLEAVIERLKAGDAATHAAWSWERRVEVFLQILHAVAFAHARGVIHRDIKPANVMIGEHGEVQLLDWGVAKTVDQVDVVGPATEVDPATSTSVTTTRAGQLIGTPRYMSPEQARGAPADAQVDTWALSMVMYELLTLSHPLDGLHTLDAVLEGIRTAPIRGPARMPTHPLQGPVPADLGWIAADGLNRDPTRRYRTVQELIDRIERRNAGDFPIQCPITFQKKVLSKASRFVDRHPIAASFLVLGGSLGVAGGLVALVGGALSVAVGAIGVAALL
jgi:serine/threonine protein kinase